MLLEDALCDGDDLLVESLVAALVATDEENRLSPRIERIDGAESAVSLPWPQLAQPISSAYEGARMREWQLVPHELQQLDHVLHVGLAPGVEGPDPGDELLCCVHDGGRHAALSFLHQVLIELAPNMPLNAYVVKSMPPGHLTGRMQGERPPKRGSSAPNVGPVSINNRPSS